MSDQQQSAPEGTELTLKIIVNDRGVFVDGPIQNEVYCLGLLEKAKQIIAEWNNRRRLEALRNEAKGKVQLATAESLKKLTH